VLRTSGSRPKELDCRNREHYKRNNLERCTEQGKPDTCRKEQSTVMHKSVRGKIEENCRWEHRMSISWTGRWRCNLVGVELSSSYQKCSFAGERCSLTEMCNPAGAELSNWTEKRNLAGAEKYNLAAVSCCLKSSPVPGFLRKD
jgi:hypothetical protein